MQIVNDEGVFGQLYDLVMHRQKEMDTVDTYIIK